MENIHFVSLVLGLNRTGSGDRWLAGGRLLDFDHLSGSAKAHTGMPGPSSLADDILGLAMVEPGLCSLWPAILAHGLANDAFGLAGRVPITEALTPEHQPTQGCR
tara:strand:- start:588 stop:902 length:315 start_codon:yes stop_codon:yes gene_type:complete